MKKKSSLLCLVSGFVISSLICFGYAQFAAAAQMESLKIGVISAQSGPVAYFGISLLRGVELAVKNINAKGTTGEGPGILVGGRRYKLEIVNYDDSADPAKSVAGMRKLAEMYKVRVVLGPLGTPQAWACQEVNVPLGILFNGMSASDQSRKKGNPLYIQERIPALHYGEPMAQACIERGFKKACVLTDINEAYMTWGKKFQQKFESLGGQVLGFESVDIKSTTDYHSIMTGLRAKNPDIILILCYEEPGALAASHALDVGYKGKFFFGSDWTVKSEKILDLHKIQGTLIDAQNHVYYAKYPDRDKRGVFTAFYKQYTETYKEAYGVAAMIHDSPWMFARAMEIANSVADVYAIRAACPKALKEGKLPLINLNNDVLENGLLYGAPELLLEVKGNGYILHKELRVERKVLE
jgi:branched-chain amino acid transport system substrate-binding protein